MLYNDKLQVANLRSVPHEHRSHTHTKGAFFWDIHQLAPVLH